MRARTPSPAASAAQVPGGLPAGRGGGISTTGFQDPGAEAQQRPQKGRGDINAETSPQPRPQTCLAGQASGHRPGRREERCARPGRSAACSPGRGSVPLQGRGPGLQRRGPAGSLTQGVWGEEAAGGGVPLVPRGSGGLCSKVRPCLPSGQEEGPAPLPGRSSGRGSQAASAVVGAPPRPGASPAAAGPAG